MIKKSLNILFGTMLISGLVIGQSTVYATSNVEEPLEEDIEFLNEVLENPEEKIMEDNMELEEETTDVEQLKEINMLNNFVPGLSIVANSFTLQEDGYQQFFARETLANGTINTINSNLTWSVSDPSIATVSPFGAVTAIKAGVITLSFTYKGKEATATLIVEKKIDYGNMSEFEVKFAKTEIGKSVMFGTLQTQKISETEAIGVSVKSFSSENLTSNLQTLESELKGNLASELTVEALPYGELNADTNFFWAGQDQGAANVATNLEIPFAYYNTHDNQVVFKSTVPSLAIKITVLD